jgi:acid phosphatase family membrane protein YuiD
MIKQLLNTQIYLVPIICGFCIQCIKVCIYSIVDRRLNLGKFVQFDGMPNLHSAVFSSLSTVIGVTYGFSSIIFSLVTAYSLIIIHDTMRLKGEKGKQVFVVNSILTSIDEYGGINNNNLLRVLSFRPLDVLCGAVLGILGALSLL